MVVGEFEPLIGILTALPKEYAAVHAMLDGPIDVSRGGRSQRKYVEGTISGSDGGVHRVALALLPSMGNNSAAHRATLLLEHFPRVRTLLMVGIAGGAPNPANPDEHVRLGDIVVSGPHGIVQYDYVAETTADTVHRHPPRPPSSAVLEAVHILEAHELAGQRPWLAQLERASSIRGSKRPDPAADVLRATPPAQGTIAHPLDPARRPGEPRVFVGIIGSANILVRDPLRRDRMRDKFKVRAFEMESSGIADASWGLDAGYLAIRGVCDYCDAAKKDTWQSYAAVVAAAYMRALLESLPALHPSAVAVESKRHHNTQRFTQQAADLFRMMHFEVESGRDFGGRQPSLFLTGSLGDIIIHRIVECMPLGGTRDEIDRFTATLRLARKEFPDATGTIVMGASLAPDLAEQARSEGVTLTTLDRLNAQLFDGRSYAMQRANAMKFDSQYRPSVYIEPMIAVDRTDGAQPATEVLQDWLADPTWNQLTLLGDVGTGKTFYTRMLFLRLADDYLSAPASRPLPVMIDLRKADRQLSLEGLISTHLQQNGLERLTFPLFQHALSSGRIILLLDGFDEMATQVTPEVTAKNFSELVKCVRGNAKVLLTCRTHYFLDRRDEEQVIYGKASDYESEAARELYWDLISRRGFRVAYLRPFERAQIEEYVRRVRPADADTTIAKIGEIYDLMELSQRPMLLEMVVSSIDRLKGTVNAATLYQIFTDVWIQRDIWRDVLPPETKHSLVTSLALRLWTSGVEHIHHRDLGVYIAQAVGVGHDPRTLVEIDSELRTASFLIRNAAGEYRFAHKSYAEFFVAGDLVRSLEDGRSDCLKIPRRLTPEHLAFFVDMVRKVAEVDALLTAVVTSDYVVNASENALLCLYALRGGMAPRARWNRISLPAGMQLNGAVLDGATLVGAELRQARLAGAHLHDADLRYCDLSFADLQHADCRSALMERGTLFWTRCQHANFTGANLTNASTARADMTGALLEGAIVVGTGLDQPDDVAEILHTWSPLIDRRVRQLLGDDPDVEDVVQRVLIELMRRSSHWLDKGTRITPALVSVLTGRAVVDIRYRYRRESPRREEGGDVLAYIASEEMNPEERVSQRELQTKLESALEDLSPETANVIRLWARGHTAHEIAMLQDISESTARRRLAAGLQRLRSTLG